MFVLTQVIGDQPELVRNSDYAENAREGFFELVAVTALVMAVLLVFDWLTRSPDGTRSHAFDRIAVLLIVLTGVVMLSALQRMRLYVELRGLTELRLYTTVFMVWIGFLLIWFVRTILINHHARFAYGLVMSAAAVVLALNLVNPDARIAQVNADWHLVGASFDQDYVTGLSLDAVPVLIEALAMDPTLDTCVLRNHLAAWADRLVTDDRGFLGASWSRSHSRSVLVDANVRPCPTS
jgi:hypothetical protein